MKPLSEIIRPILNEYFSPRGYVGIVELERALIEKINENTDECGNANPNGNIALTFKGGCMEKLATKDAYRCTGCDGNFHKDCILEHFKLEEMHDWGRHKERSKVIRWLYNYWKTLKEQGMSEKKFIINFDKYLKSLAQPQEELNQISDTEREIIEKNYGRK